MKALKYFSYILCLILLELSVLRTYDLITDKNYYGWPVVTQCRICNKTVWIWQNYERRAFTIKNSGNYSAISASGLVHKHCKGNPDFECDVSLK